jgi:hypothetical protein
MADRLNADVDALELFASQLDVTRSQFDATAKSISCDGLGDPRLTAALADFSQRWGTHREVLDSYFSALSRMVGDSAKTLRQQDANLAQIHLAGVQHRQASLS